MHGSICCIVKKFVETQFGKAAWDEILVTAGFEGLQLSPIGVYPRRGRDCSFGCRLRVA